MTNKRIKESTVNEIRQIIENHGGVSKYPKNKLKGSSELNKLKNSNMNKYEISKLNFIIDSIYNGMDNETIMFVSPKDRQKEDLSVLEADIAAINAAFKGKTNSEEIQEASDDTPRKEEDTMKGKKENKKKEVYDFGFRFGDEEVAASKEEKKDKKKKKKDKKKNKEKNVSVEVPEGVKHIIDDIIDEYASSKKEKDKKKKKKDADGTDKKENKEPVEVVDSGNEFFNEVNNRYSEEFNKSHEEWLASMKEATKKAKEAKKERKKAEFKEKTAAMKDKVPFKMPEIKLGKKKKSS